VLFPEFIRAFPLSLQRRDLAVSLVRARPAFHLDARDGRETARAPFGKRIRDPVSALRAGTFLPRPHRLERLAAGHAW